MKRTGMVLVSSALVAAAPSVVRPQASTGDSEVHIYVSLADSSTRFYPVPGHRMIIYRSARDSAIVTTDSSGSTTIHLPPGQYRLVSAAPVRWRNSDYSWNVPIVVRSAYTIIDLRAPDAVGSAAVVARGVQDARAGAHDQPRPVIDTAQTSGYYRTQSRAKDPGQALLWSVIIPGEGRSTPKKPARA